MNLLLLLSIFAQCLSMTWGQQCQNPVEALILMDGSGSIREAFPAQKRFAARTVDVFANNLTAGARLGIMQYATGLESDSGIGIPYTSIECPATDDPRERDANCFGFPLTANLTGLSADITKINHMNGYTPTGSALQSAYDYYKENGRSGTTRLIILISDGRPTSCTSEACLNPSAPQEPSRNYAAQEDTFEVARAIKADATVILSVGVNIQSNDGSNFNQNGQRRIINSTEEIMREVASEPKDRFTISVDNFEQLYEKLADITGFLCQGLTEISADCGLLGGGMRITISGSGFLDGPELKCRFKGPNDKVLFGDVEYIQSARAGTKIVCIQPPSDEVGEYELAVTADGRGFTDAARFVYVNDLESCDLIIGEVGLTFVAIGLPLMIIPMLALLVPTAAAPAAGAPYTGVSAPAAPANPPAAGALGKKWNVASDKYMRGTGGNIGVQWGETAPESAPRAHDEKDAWIRPDGSSKQSNYTEFSPGQGEGGRAGPSTDMGPSGQKGWCAKCAIL